MFSNRLDLTDDQTIAVLNTLSEKGYEVETNNQFDSDIIFYEWDAYWGEMYEMMFLDIRADVSNGPEENIIYYRRILIMSPFVIALILFAITYVLLFALPKYRAWVAFVSAIIFSIWLSFLCNDIEFGFKDIFGAIDFNVLMMIAGTMGIVILFIESNMPMRIADVLLSKFKNVKMAIVHRLLENFQAWFIMM